MLIETLPAAVIFDMDGVLIDSEPMHAESYITVFAEIGLPITLEDYYREISRGDLTVSQLYASAGGNIDRWHEVSAKKSALIRDMMAEKGALMPGVVNLLESLNAAEIPAALATSAGKRSLGIFMDSFDLRPYFKHMVTWEDVKAIKPDPHAFVMAAEKLGVKCGDCVVLEDSPRGVLAASRAGMKCIAIPNNSTRDGNFSTASLMVNSLKEVSIATMRSLF